LDTDITCVANIELVNGADVVEGFDLQLQDCQLRRRGVGQVSHGNCARVFTIPPAGGLGEPYFWFVRGRLHYCLVACLFVCDFFDESTLF
jgi:hypothetical protein